MKNYTSLATPSVLEEDIHALHATICFHTIGGDCEI
jgi:hypothetical protein